MSDIFKIFLLVTIGLLIIRITTVYIIHKWQIHWCIDDNSNYIIMTLKNFKALYQKNPENFCNSFCNSILELNRSERKKLRYILRANSVRELMNYSSGGKIYYFTGSNYFTNLYMYYKILNYYKNKKHKERKSKYDECMRNGDNLLTSELTKFIK